ncbi:MAG: hypothetical protein ACE37F_19405 [Nannocystaceae bacterium]|nr:hypothetical protein [bacterium]
MIRVRISLTPRSLRPRSRSVAALAVGLAALPVFALASPVEPLTEFAAGEPIVAADFNDNFGAVSDAVDDNDARITALESATDGGVPAGAVVFFDASECPVGWTELTEARGRAVVGMNGSAATLLGTVGEALEDLENPVHSHTTDIPSFSTGSASVAHTHTVPSHTTNSAGSHNHQWKDGLLTSFNASGNPLNFGPFPAASGPGATIPNYGSADTFTDNDGTHSHSVSAFSTTAASSTSHAHAVDPPLTASTAVATSDVIPYVQLLACRRG